MDVGQTYGWHRLVIPDQVHGTNEGLTAAGPVITGGRAPDICSGACAKVSQLPQIQWVVKAGFGTAKETTGKNFRDALRHSIRQCRCCSEAERH